jgi:hypothetical protein
MAIEGRYALHQRPRGEVGFGFVVCETPISSAGKSAEEGKNTL